MKGFPFLVAGTESMRVRELVRVERSFLLAAGLSVWAAKKR